MDEIRDLSSSGNTHRLWALTIPAAVFMVSLLLTAAICVWVSQRNQQTTDAAMVAAAQDAVEVIQSRLQRYQYGLRGARGSILTGGEHTVTREQFKRYSASRDLTVEFPGARGFGFIRRVPASDEAAFVAAVRSDGMPDFSIRKLSPHDGELYVIQYIEPVEQNLLAVGLDIASEPNRKAAAQISMRSGEAALTAPITLIQSADPSKQSFLFMMPIYRNGITPPGEAERIEATYGWSYAALSMEDVLGDSGIDLQRARLQLQDQTSADRPVPFYSTAQPAGATSPIGSYSIVQTFFGRTWRLTLSVYPAFADTLPLIAVKTLALGGVLTSLLLSILMLLWNNGRLRKKQLLAAQLQLAEIVESSLDGIIGKTLTGVVVSWNKGAERLFGYSSSEAVGQLLSSLIVPANALGEESQILETVGKGRVVEHFQTIRRHRNGHFIEVSVSVSPIYSTDGRVIGASKTLRDISKEKAAEAQVLAANIRLEEQVQARTSELETAQRALRTVLDAVPSMIGSWDVNLINRFANHAYQTWFGVDPLTLPGRAMKDVLSERLVESSRPYIDAVLRGEAQTFERTIIGPDGKVRHSLTHYVPDIAQDEVIGFFVIAHNVTELTESRLRLAEALRQNELLLHAINEQLLYSATDAKGLIVEVNDHFAEVHGYAREDLMGQDHRMLSSQLHDESFWQSMWATLLQGEAWRGEMCNRAFDGSLHWFDTVIAPSFDSAGMIERYITLRIEVTQRRKSEAELSRLHLLLGSVLRAASEVSIIATDVDGRITVFNSGAQRMLGYQEDEMVGVLGANRIHLADEVAERSRVLSELFGEPIEGFRVFVHVAEIEGSETREWTFLRKDGTQLTVSLVVTPMRDGTGHITGYLGIATDITEQRRQRLDLAAARDQLVLAAEAAKLGIWSWVLTDKDMHWNDLMFSLYALPESADGRGTTYEDWCSRLHPDDILATEASLAAAIDGRGVYDPVFRVLRPDGTIRFVQAGAYVDRDQQGKATRLIGINLDITERKEFEAQLLSAKQQAEQASVVKGQFLANMSHEIRTPLNAVLGMLQLLRQARLNTRQEDYATKAQSAARSLLSLLNDILDFSKIEASKLELDLYPFSLEKLMRDLSVVLSGNLADKDVEILFEIAPQLPSVLIGDQLRLQQVLINLAGNAIKFTTEGHVLVRFVELARTQDQVSLRISVSDTGIGISPAQLERIFDGFTQAEASTTRRFGGTGLGLSISKRLVELMGGELQIVSEEGKGSEFWFDVTLTVEDLTPLTQASSAQRRRVLVVDDNQLSKQIMVRMIEAYGWDVDFANGGHAAVQSVKDALARDRAFDLVVMDWRMPDLNGLAAARLIKKTAGDAKPPAIVMVTAFGHEELASIDGDGAPFEAFLTKPVTPHQLFDAIEHALGGGKILKAPVQEKSAPQLQGLRLLVVEDNALNRQVVRELLGAEGAEVTLAEGGIDGVEFATRRPGEFDAVIMDVQMPDIDGMEATRRIRADQRFQSLPILAMTANVSHTDRVNCLASGMNEHVGKPIDMAEVIPLLQQLTGRPDSAWNMPVETSVAQTVDLVEPLAKVLLRLGGMHDLYRMVLVSFKDEGERLLSQMQALMQTGDANDIANTLHTLRGVASTVGASALAQCAKDIEVFAKANPQMPVEHILPAEMMSTLEGLVSDSAIMLQQAFDAEYPGEAPVELEVAPFSPEQRDACLETLLITLIAGNMEAIDLVDDLELHSTESDKAVFVRLAEQVRNLDFDNAILAIGQLFKGKK
jgi:PAS domain S-box-containing protein